VTRNEIKACVRNLELVSKASYKQDAISTTLEGCLSGVLGVLGIIIDADGTASAWGPRNEAEPKRSRRWIAWAHGMQRHQIRAEELNQ
jgi:hypothetical protein